MVVPIGVGTITAHVVYDWECLRTHLPDKVIQNTEVVDPSWSKFGSNDFPSSTNDKLLGRNFNPFFQTHMPAILL